MAANAAVGTHSTGMHSCLSSSITGFFPFGSVQGSITGKYYIINCASTSPHPPCDDNDEDNNDDDYDDEDDGMMMMMMMMIIIIIIIII